MDFKEPSTRSLSAKLASKQDYGERKSACSSVSNALRPSSITICKKKSMLGRRRTQLFQSADLLTPIRNLRSRPSSCNIAKNSPAWVITPRPDHSRCFDSDKASQFGPWSASKRGPPLEDVRTPKQRRQLEHPPRVSCTLSHNDSEDEETKQKLQELEKMPLNKTAGRTMLADSQEAKAMDYLQPRPITCALNKTSSLQSLRRVTFSPGRQSQPTKSPINTRNDETFDKRDIRQRIKEKMKEYKELATEMTALCSEIIQLQEELDRVPNVLATTSSEGEINPYVEAEEHARIKDEKQQDANKYLPYTPRSLKKAYKTQLRDIFTRE